MEPLHPGAGRGGISNCLCGAQRGQWRKNHVKGMADKDLEKELAKADIEPMRVQRTVAMAGDEDGTTKKKSKPKTTVISVTQARSALRNSDTL